MLQITIFVERLTRGKKKWMHSRTNFTKNKLKYLVSFNKNLYPIQITFECAAPIHLSVIEWLLPLHSLPNL